MSGYLIKVNFKDGDDTIKEGDLLYEIDPRPFQADLDQANGNVERLEAEKKLLAIQVDRYRKLADEGGRQPAGPRPVSGPAGGERRRAEDRPRPRWSGPS